MARYQSFPGAPGDSRSLEKLKHLKLPALDGKRFLDVGCNEGFFCGYALFDGAARSVGVDRSAGFIERAKQRYPGCEFICRGWEDLPPGPFDVILLASALHYAEDQPALIQSLIERLAPNGVLVLELGIASSQESEWVRVKRGIDERYFPSMPKLKDVLKDHAWKWLGPSILQDGDPVPRHVIHVHRRRPLAYLLMEPPGYGKTTIAAALFPGDNLPIVSGDDLLQRIAQGKVIAPRDLTKIVSKEFSPYNLDASIQRIFGSGMGSAWVRCWIEQAKGLDFAFDGYVPGQWHAHVRDVLAQEGYMPVQLQWDRLVEPSRSKESMTERADAYFSHLADTAPSGQSSLEGGRHGARGFIDDISIGENVVRLRGWAMDSRGRPARTIRLSVDGNEVKHATMRRSPRPDVVKRTGSGDLQCGFDIEAELGGLAVSGQVPGLAAVAFGIEPGDAWRLDLTKRMSRVSSSRGAGQVPRKKPTDSNSSENAK